MKQGVVGNGEDAQPAIFRVLVVQPPLEPLHSDDGVVLAVQFPPVDPVEQVLYIDLKFINMRGKGNAVIQKIACVVADVIGASGRQVLGAVVLLEQAGGQDNGDGIAGAGIGGGNRNHRFVVDGAEVGVGKNDFSLALYSLLIPEPVPHVLLGKAVAGNQAALHYHAHMGVANVQQPAVFIKVVLYPGGDLIDAGAVGAQVAEIGHAQGYHIFVFIQAAILVLGIAGYQILPHCSGIIQQQLLADKYSRRGHHGQQGQNPEDLPAAERAAPLVVLHHCSPLFGQALVRPAKLFPAKRERIIIQAIVYHMKTGLSKFNR